MALENTHASEFVHELSQLICDKLKSGLKHIILLGSLQSVHKHCHVGIKRVFVHVRNFGKAEQSEAKNGSTFGNTLVRLTIGVDVFRGLFSVDECLLNLDGLSFSHVKSLNQGHVINKRNVCFFRQL